MAQDGRDPGEYEPLVIYWYDFDKATKSWKRHPISVNDPAGGGLDPKAIDIDADGDLDLVMADRNGLYLFENLLMSKPSSR
jgi:hypothetical protein